MGGSRQRTQPYIFMDLKALPTSTVAAGIRTKRKGGRLACVAARNLLVPAPELTHTFVNYHLIK